MRDEALEVAALRALAGEAQVSPDGAARLLDDSGFHLEDVPDGDLRPLWAVVVDRLRRRQGLDFVGIRDTLKASPQRVRDVALDVLTDYEMGATAERLRLLHDSGTRTRYVEALRAAAVAAKEGAPLADLERMAREAAQLPQSSGRVRSCVGDASALMDKLESIWSGNAPPILRTGFHALDEVLGGLVNNLIALGARSGVGKSALVAGFVRNWVGQGVKVGVLAYEDDCRDMESRLVAERAGVSVKKVRGEVFATREERASIHEALAWLSKHEAMIETDDARPSGSIGDVVASMRTLRRRGCRVILLDNLTCVRMDVGDRHDLVVEAALRDIREEAQALQVPAFVVGHIRRGADTGDEDRRPPRKSDFSNSTAWENYSRVMLGMWRDGNGIACRVLKQTNGADGDDFSVEVAKEAAVVTGFTLRQSAPEVKPSPLEPKKHQRSKTPWPRMQEQQDFTQGDNT